VLNTPVVSGNVSFTTKPEGKGILPTPVIGMVGLIEDVRRVIQPGFKHDRDVIALLGETNDDLSNQRIRRRGRRTIDGRDDCQWPRAAD